MKKQIYLFSTTSHEKALHVNSLHVEFLKPTIDFSQYDYLVLTSKQTIKALAQYDKKEFINLPALCVSNKTASEYENFGGKVLQTGNGYGDDLARVIQNYPKDTRWLYLRAKLIASDFAQKSQDKGYKVDEKIVYKSECSKEILEIKIEENSILIFTSPSAVNCFFQHKTIDKNSIIIVIGNSTAKSLPKNLEYNISQNSSIRSCIDLALNFKKVL